MRNIIGLSMGAVLLTSPAIADDNVLATPPMHPGTSIECFAANIGNKTVRLLIEMVDQNGAVPFNEMCQLPPGTINAGGALCAALEGAPTIGWCRFTVTSGSTQDIRASICSIDDNLGVGASPSCLSAQASDRH
jgi:hypothetical protein